MSTPRKSVSKHDAELQGREGATFEIEVVNRQRVRPISNTTIANLSRAVLDRVGRVDATLTVTFIRDRLMRELNRDYRGIDRPTDVLSFAYSEIPNHNKDRQNDWNGSNHLGDVVISVETAERYARELGVPFESEIEHLVIHGALHLAGYDHETDHGEMNRLEKKLRKELLK